MRKIWLVAVIALFACGGKKREEPQGDCAASVNHAIDLSKDDYKKSNVADETIPKIRAASLQRCTEDKWSNEVLKCLVEAKATDDVIKCQQKMTKEQGANLGKSISAVMAAAQPADGSAGSADQGSAGSAGSAGSGDGSAAAAPPGDLPAECAQYKAATEKLAACDKIPQASRDVLKQSFEQMAKSWDNIAKLPEASRKSLIDGCKQGVEALKKAGGDACGL